MNDGWDDDDDDDVNVDDLLEDWGGEGGGDAVVVASDSTMDDDGLVERDDADSAPPMAPSILEDSRQQQHPQEEEEEEDVGGGGWDDDDDLDLNFSEHHNDDNNLQQEISWNNNNDGLAPRPPLATTTSSSVEAAAASGTAVEQPALSPPPAAVADEGWGDDEDDLEFSAHSNNCEDNTTMAKTIAVAPPDDAPGWNDKDLEEFDFSETSAGGGATEEDAEETLPFSAAADPTYTLKEQRWRQELTHYLETLPAHAQSITAVLQAEYNTPAKAFELQQYYQERPQLLQYTVEKELARMDYTLITPAGDIVTDKTEIAQHFHHHVGAASSSQVDAILTPRCANQSLLADIVQVLTGPDRLVRPQYLSAAVASQCKLRVDLAQHVVEIVAALDLSLPSSSSSGTRTNAARWKIAELAVVVVFVCPPVIQQPQGNHNSRIHEPFVE